MKFDDATEKFIEKSAQTWLKLGKSHTDFLWVWYRIYDRIKVLREGK